MVMQFCAVKLFDPYVDIAWPIRSGLWPILSVIKYYEVIWSEPKWFMADMVFLLLSNRVQPIRTSDIEHR